MENKMNKLTQEEKQIIINVLSQLQFKVGQSKDIEVIENIIEKLLKED